MKTKYRILFTVAMPLTIAMGPVGAAELQQIATIQIPGEKLKGFDISYVDHKAGKYYLADRSNKAVDIFDTKTFSFVDRLTGFSGIKYKEGKPDNDTSGPDGVLTIGNQVWAGDGDSTIKVIDQKSHHVVDVINTGGKTRVDEMAYDLKDKVFIGINNAEDPPFATLISTRPGHRVIGKVAISNATDGFEQPAYNPQDGLFYVSVPELDKNAKKGGVAVIDPRAGKLVKIITVENCHPNGLAFGPESNFILGCDANGKEMPAITIIMNAKTGQVVATIPNLGGSDMVNYNHKNNQYYTASSKNPGGPVLGVIDAKTNTLVQTIPIQGGNPHSVTSSEKDGHVFVPVGAMGGGDGTIHVFASK